MASWVDLWWENVDQMKPTPMTDFYTSADIRALGIKCGERCLLHKNTLVYGHANIELGHDVRIDAFNVLSCATGSIKIGNHVHISSHCLFIGASGISIGNYSNVAAGSKLFSSSDDLSGRFLIGPCVPSTSRGVKSSPITLRDHSCLAVNAVVMPGSTLEFGSVLYANSLLKGSTEPYGVYMGTPATRIKDRSRDFLKYVPQEPAQLE